MFYNIDILCAAEQEDSIAQFSFFRSAGTGPLLLDIGNDSDVGKGK
jgi:hypothetical protein